MKCKILAIFATLWLSACTANYAIYEAPSLGPTAEITFINRSENQSASLATFDDGNTCTRRRHIQFDGSGGVPAGETRTMTIPAGGEFALFASLDTLRVDEYEIDMGVTGGGPRPARSQSVAAIGCSARISFAVEEDKHYQVALSAPDTEESCSVVVSESRAGGMPKEVRAHERAARFSSDEEGSFCVPL